MLYKLYFLKKKKSRELALQIMYSLINKKENIKSKIKEFKLINPNIFNNTNINYLYEILNGIKKNKKKIKKIIYSNLNLKTKYIAKIEFIILEIAIYELKIKKKLSHKIIINESIILAKKFGLNNSYKLINSILDNIYHNKKK